jgi:hypothetical protein
MKAMTSRVACLYVILLGSFILGSASAADRCCVPITVDITGGSELMGQPTLKVVVRNTGRNTLLIDKPALPWGNRYSITLLAAGANSQPVPLVFPIDDPIGEEISLKPAESAEGIIRLDSFFKDIRAAMKRTPLIVLWSYRLKTKGGEESEIITGQVVLPATGPAAIPPGK